MIDRFIYEDIVKEALAKQSSKTPDVCRCERLVSEDDFYQQFDCRVWTSNIEDIEGGDSFADYCKYFFELCDEEGYFD